MIRQWKPSAEYGDARDNAEQNCESKPHAGRTPASRTKAAQLLSGLILRAGRMDLPDADTFGLRWK